MEIESETISSKVDKIISISNTNDYVKLLDEPYEHAKYLQTLIREYYRSEYDVIKLSKLLDLMYECNYGVNENGELYLKMIKTECIYLKLQAFKLFKNHLNSEVPEHHEILNKFIFNVPFVPKVDSSILPSGFRIDHDSIYFTPADLVEFDINTPNNLLRYQCAIEVIKVLQNRNISINETLFSSIKYTFKYYYDNIESFYDNLKNDFNLINNFVRYSIEIINILYGKTDHDLIRSIIVLTFNIVTNASSSCKASFLSMLLSKKEFGLSVEMVIDKNHFLIGTNESVKILYVKFVSSIIELNKSKQLLSHLEGQLLNIASRIKLNLSDVAYENDNDTTYSNIILMNTIIRSYVQLIYNILNDKIDYQPNLNYH